MDGVATGAGRAPVELRLLNGFHVSRGGEAIDLPSSAERLLAYLAIQDGPVRRLQASSTLWIDATDDHAAASLRSALWRLRQPGQPLVTATTTHVGLAPEVIVDLTASTLLARTLVAGRVAGDLPVDAVAALDEDLLPGWYDDDWVLFCRERWRQLRMHALEALAALLAAHGRYGEAVDAAYAAVRVEPLRESAHRALIAVHLAEGNRSEALLEFRTFTRMLREELDVTPSPHLMSLIAPFTVR
jgi:DNA-binding SARP family transcriptional activator